MAEQGAVNSKVCRFESYLVSDEGFASLLGVEENLMDVLLNTSFGDTSYVSVVQWKEFLTTNQAVAGSNPAGDATKAGS